MTDLFLRRGLKYGETAESIFPAKSFYDYRYSGENETSAGKYTMRGKNKLNFQNYNTRQVGNRQSGNREYKGQMDKVGLYSYSNMETLGLLYYLLRLTYRDD